MNARIGSDFAPGIGRLHAQEECANGLCFREMITENDMMIPSTFSQYHSGTGNTFQRHRLDYIAIPNSWQECVQKSEVSLDFDTLHAKDDHKPLTMMLSFAVSKFVQTSEPCFDKKKACDPGNAGALERIFSSFCEPAWESSVDDHSAALTRHVHSELCRVFPICKKERQVQQPYITGSLWDLVMERKNMRNEIRRNKNRKLMYVVRACWMAWRGKSDEALVNAKEKNVNLLYLAFLEEILEDSDRKIAQRIKKDKQRCLSETLVKLESAFRTKNNKQIFEALKPFQSQCSRRKVKNPKPLPHLMGDSGVVENLNDWHDAWESHWARIEGAKVTDWHEHQQSFENNEVNFACLRKEILEAVPTMLQVEHAVRGIKRGKAGGIDGICPDVVKLAGGAAAKCIFTLATKEMVRGQVPLSDRGGLSLPLYKNKGHQSERNSFRSIVLENCIGKAISRLWRPELECAFKRLAGSAQGGAKKGMGPTTHILRARVLQQRAFLCGDSFGLILLDMESAFYKAVRQLLVQQDDFEATDEYCAYFSKKLGICPEQHREFYQHLRGETMLEKAKANKAIQKWVLSSMTGSWCKLRSSQKCLSTSLGTKPGDPTADVLYSMVMTKYLHLVQTKFKERVDLNKCIHAMTWVDDVIVPFQEKAEGVHQKAGQILEIMHDSATELGMTPNLKRGKTEVVLGFAGAGAQSSKRSFEQGEPFVYFDTVSGPKQVEVVSEAVYLGAVLDAKGSVLPEIMLCTGKALGGVRPLKKAVPCNDRIPRTQRRAIIQSLALSKTNYSAGSWLPMRRSEERTWNTRVRKIFRLLVPTKFGEAERMTDESILVLFGLLSPREMVSVATLRLCAMMAQWADEQYLAPFVDEYSMHEKTWMSQAVKELNHLSVKVRTGWDVFTDFGGAMQTLKSPTAQKAMGKFLAKYSKALLHQREQAWMIAQNRPKDVLSLRDGNTEEKEVTCRKCGKSFRSEAALGVHRYQIHGDFCEAYSFAPSSTCYICQGQYHSRERLVRHLQWGSMGCLDQLRETVEPLTKAQIVYLNLQDRERYHESRKLGKKHKDQSKTFCRDEIADVTDVTGNWDDFFEWQNMDDQEREEMASLEEWSINGPLLCIFEDLPDYHRLQEALEHIGRMACTLKCAKVVLKWFEMLQQDLWAIYGERDDRADVMAAWAKTRADALSRFM